jgi:DNA-binding NtrC family response regulator
VERRSHDKVPRNAGTIMIVEDDANLREIIAEFLESAGFKTITAEGIEEAVRLAPQHQINVVLADVVLKDGLGTTLPDRIGKACPKAKFIYMSGYAQSPELLAAHEAGTARFLRKPFSRNDLIKAIQAEIQAENEITAQ